MISPQIIFEDNLLLVVDKPAGIVVNRSDTTAKTPTVQDWIESINPMTNPNVQFPNANDRTLKEFVSRSGIVHRLDKDTSGLLVIAKTLEAFAKLKEQFKTRETVKKYLALVHGRVEPAEGQINAPIERNPFNRKHFGVFPGGREATTQYRVLRNYQFTIYNLQFSLLELMPQTGRTHQIRVHLRYINHPIVSDPIYGGRKTYRDDLRICPRLFLHATHLTIVHPILGKAMEFDCPLPEDLAAALALLQTGVG